MKVLVFGSLNIDYVYSVEHFVRPGETIASSDRQVFCGGKGLNQAISFAKYGLETWMSGAVGKDDSDVLLEALNNANVNTSLVKHKNGPSGHTIIQNTPDGENNIILFGGANQSLTKEDVDETLSHFEKGDLLILQNEINMIPYIMEKAYAKGMRIVLNPSPMNEKILEMPLEYAEYLVLNEIEAGGILSIDDTNGEILMNKLREKFPSTKIVLTLGESGSLYSDEKSSCHCGIFSVKPVDTTGAGDTFMGYFIGEVTSGNIPQDALRIASAASAIAVSRKGASVSIPTRTEVISFLSKH